MSFVQLRLCDIWIRLLWNENLLAGADRCACSICTGTHSSDKKLNALILPGFDLWSCLQQRVMLFLCVFNTVSISGSVCPPGSGNAAEFIFVTETPSASPPSISGDCFWCPWRTGLLVWVWSSPILSICLAGIMLDMDLWWHYTQILMEGTLNHDLNFFFFSWSLIYLILINTLMFHSNKFPVLLWPGESECKQRSQLFT